MLLISQLKYIFHTYDEKNISNLFPTLNIQQTKPNVNNKWVKQKQTRLQCDELPFVWAPLFMVESSAGRKYAPMQASVPMVTMPW